MSVCVILLRVAKLGSICKKLTLSIWLCWQPEMVANVLSVAALVVVTLTTASFANEQVPEQLTTDNNGYILYCPCMGLSYPKIPSECEVNVKCKICTRPTRLFIDTPSGPRTMTARSISTSQRTLLTGELSSVCIWEMDGIGSVIIISFHFWALR